MPSDRTKHSEWDRRTETRKREEEERGEAALRGPSAEKRLIGFFSELTELQELHVLTQ